MSSEKVKLLSIEGNSEVHTDRTKIKPNIKQENDLNADNEIWEAVNNLWKDVYLGNKLITRQKFKKLIEYSQNMKKKNSKLIKLLLRIGKEMKNYDKNNEKFWLTSKVGNMMYPPIDIENASPIPWNNTKLLKLNLGKSTSLTQRYPDVTSLFVNEGVVSSIEQNPDISNCSLITSLININRFKHEYYPKIKKLSDAPSNRYHLNLCFNGCTNRLISVDTDHIPYNKKTHKQLSLYSNNIKDKIVELAYLQIHGGTYKSSGSNVAMDTYLLTGLLPEISSTKKYSFEKLKQFFEANLCIMALGTGDDSSKLGSPLLKNHDYSILEFDSKKREISIQDPLNSKSTLTISEDELKNKFSQIYINWDTNKLFNSETKFTFYYNAEIFNKFESNFDKPIFSIQNKSASANETIWILLETHLTPNHFTEVHYAYLQPVPDKMTDPLFMPIDSASNIGLQLIKIDIPKGKNKKFICYSNLSKWFTIHCFSVENDIELKILDTADIYKSTEFLTYTDQMNKNYGHPQYFTNPTFQLCVQSKIDKEIMITLQFLSKLNDLKLNFQLFDKDDLYLSKPILFDQYYYIQHYEKHNIPLETNHNYILICTCSSNETILNEFKLIGYCFKDKNNVKDLELNKNILLQRIDRTFGELPYRKEFTFQLPSSPTLEHDYNHGHIQYQISNIDKEIKSNELFIRLTPMNKCIGDRGVGLNLKFSVKIYDSETFEILHDESGYYYKGIIINDFKFTINHSPIISIEMNELTKQHVFPMKIYLGSRKDILVNMKGVKK